MILMDTDICVELLRGNQRVIERRRNVAGEIAVAFMTVGELFYGADRSTQPARNHELVERFLLSVTCIHSNRHIMERFGNLKAHLATRGETLPDADILIAATTLTHADAVVSGNQAHFARFPGLTVLDWTR